MVASTSTMWRNVAALLTVTHCAWARISWSGLVMTTDCWELLLSSASER
jgi:hypothetical protein